MAVILHLSDLHLGPQPETEGASPEQPQYAVRIASIVAGLEQWRRESPGQVCALVMSGDILDTSTTTPDEVRRILGHLVGELRRVLSDATLPVLLVPGNHDRRRLGTVRSAGPVIATLRELCTSRACTDSLSHVLSAFARDPIRALRIPGVPFRVVLQDSTHLDSGYISAGGTVNAEDVLSIAAELENDDSSPVVWVLHHHLVPTPITDLEMVGAGRFRGAKEVVTRFVLRLAGLLFANADREETSMTVLGAGSMLTMLHTLGRPVLLLHGHKHYPTARVLHGVRSGEGDVALVAAGSSGVTERPEARLMSVWPSFTAIHVDQVDASWDVMVNTVTFPPAGRKHNILVNPMLSLRSDGAGWKVRPVAAAPASNAMLRNRARYALVPIPERGSFNLHVTRECVFRETGAKLSEPIQGLPGARVLLDDGSVARLPKTLPIPVSGSRADLKYQIERACAITQAEAERAYGARTEYEWVGLPNRLGAELAELELVGDTAGRLASAFGSVTDITSGRETPVRLARTADAAILSVRDCPPRSLLRIYWRLEA